MSRIESRSLCVTCNGLDNTSDGRRLRSMEMKTRFCNEGMMVAGVGRCLRLGLGLDCDYRQRLRLNEC